MDITYKNKTIREMCTDAKLSDRKYGNEMSTRIKQRIGEIRAADTVEELIFEKHGNTIQIAHIIEIVDYH